MSTAMTNIQLHLKLGFHVFNAKSGLTILVRVEIVTGRKTLFFELKVKKNY